MSEAFIVASVRTPIGRFGGVLRDLSPVELGAHAMRAALERAGIDGADLDLYILGNVLRAGHGQLVPRQAAIKAGIPQEVDGYAIDMVCSGAMMAVINAANLIRLGDADLVLAGGGEAMSQGGVYVSRRARWGFGRGGVLPAGNSSEMSDGAAALVLASSQAVERHRLRPVARVLGGSWAAGETWRFPEAPIPAVKKLLSKLDLELTDFDVFENNEAFALNNILFHRMLGVRYEQLNPFGGAVALGHPLGASGVRILVTLLNALDHRAGRRGLAAICHGSGGGTAPAAERLPATHPS